ncbi:serine/threonine protein kinase [Cellulomonas sp. APG4]|uniref:serine/threonine-protein kinase n=1 Tax=Cellulomonas sp. APG4 TaxID=1538656 RepID=UPI00137B6B77|nr:serine/threonine-protein kinase [Cellulomonas sp. APG4]NCT92539.1 serine/threonine protein kinase [Cellulomonas sp. APG4]
MERIGVAPGTEVGGYRVLGPLGQGGMGAVYRAADGEGALVALKLLHPHLGQDPDARERLRREVAHLQRVRHPGVARVLDAEIDSTDAFVVTELLDGQDLAAHVREHGPLGADDLAELAEQLRAALEVVHAAGVLHRDLTPGNVLMTSRGAVLIDFGIAQAVDEARVTSTGLVAGTPGYLSPELLEGGEPSEAADWWGWAALLAFAATGRAPFGTRPLQAVLARARAGEPDLDGLDRRTSAALRSALSVDPWRRASAATVVEELELAATGDTDPGPGGGQDADGVATTLTPLEPATAVVAAGGAGGTRVLPVDDDATAVQSLPAQDEDDAYDDDAYADEVYEDEAYEGTEDHAGPQAVPAQDGAPEAPWAPPVPRRRTGTVLALGAVLLAAGAARPGVALVVAAVLAVLVRAVGLAVDQVHGRRARRGPGRGDVAGSVALAPWHLLRGLLGVLPAALVGASLVVMTGGVGWWLLDTGRLHVVGPAPGEAPGELADNAPWVTAALLAVAVLIGLLVLWFGPMSRRTRAGARWTLAALAPPTAVAVGLVLVCLVATGALVALVLLGHGTVWWPLPGPPDLR